MLTLKKYANGRLFDTVNKQYMTKDQLSKLVKRKEKVKVILAKTGKDVTKSVVSSLPAVKTVKTNSKTGSLLKKKAIKIRVEGHKKWITMQIDKRMNTILEMMSFPNKQQVAKLNTDVKKLAKKIDDLQKRHAKAREKMKLEHQKEMERLIKQYDKPAIPVKKRSATKTA
ncbi:MAG: polyhydroxyalkanoate synthesis regulator DNA-binding domain-containing protein [Deltaproteobacteria bacterium]|nr:polyhydroxyalkanoate synthesis regulator DNA-binding domain-containing protein [Deltaproteobacteria bacterium]